MDVIGMTNMAEAKLAGGGDLLLYHRLRDGIMTAGTRSMNP